MHTLTLHPPAAALPHARTHTQTRSLSLSLALSSLYFVFVFKADHEEGSTGDAALQHPGNWYKDAASARKRKAQPRRSGITNNND